MCHKAVVLALALVLSSLTFAQRNPKQSAAGAGPLASETCAFTFKSGKGFLATQYCVTANGNIASFSTAGVDMLAGVRPAIEGYGICDVTNSQTNYWDFANTDSGNWNPATAVLTNPKTVTVTRTTADGLWKLVQTIASTPASKTNYGSAKITMALTNTSATDKVVLLERHVNPDAGGQFAAAFNNFEATSFTVNAFNEPSGGGTGFTSSANLLTTNFDFQFALILPLPDAPTPCSPGGNTSLFTGDGSMLQEFNLEIAPGATKSAVVTYKPI